MRAQLHDLSFELAAVASTFDGIDPQSHENKQDTASLMEPLRLHRLWSLEFFQRPLMMAAR